MRRFEVVSDTLLKRLQTSCGVSHASKSGDPLPSFHKSTAIWDTGANYSIVSDEIIKQCGLQPIGRALVTSTHGEAETDAYLVNLQLPNNIVFLNVKVVRSLFPVPVVIGMDVLSKGRFTVEKRGQRTVWSFEVE